MKKEEKTELTRKRILAAAMKEFGENGYQGASLNRICDIGIPKGLLYHNFENRDALYLACLEQSFATFTGFLREDGLGLGCSTTWIHGCIFSKAIHGRPVYSLRQSFSRLYSSRTRSGR